MPKSDAWEELNSWGKKKRSTPRVIPGRVTETTEERNYLDTPRRSGSLREEAFAPRKTKHAESCHSEAKLSGVRAVSTMLYSPLLPQLISRRTSARSGCPWRVPP